MGLGLVYNKRHPQTKKVRIEGPTGLGERRLKFKVDVANASATPNKSQNSCSGSV